VQEEVFLAEVELEDLLLGCFLLLRLVLLQDGRPLGRGLCSVEFLLFVELSLALARWHKIISTVL
jgi:hypothetical protein